MQVQDDLFMFLARGYVKQAHPGKLGLAELAPLKLGHLVWQLVEQRFVGGQVRTGRVSGGEAPGLWQVVLLCVCVTEIWKSFAGCGTI